MKAINKLKTVGIGSGNLASAVLKNNKKKRICSKNEINKAILIIMYLLSRQPKEPHM